LPLVSQRARCYCLALPRSYCSADHRYLHSFPTRRSSDLVGSRIDPVTRSVSVRAHIDNSSGMLRPGMLLTVSLALDSEEVTVVRSEEHTSELQSRENLVCRLLLEKKKKEHGHN